MRLQRKSLEQPMHRRFRNPAGLGCQAHRPVRAGGGFTRQGALQQSGNLVIGDGAGPSRPQFIIEPSQAVTNETLAPLANGGVGPAQPASDAGVVFALGRPQHELGAAYKRVRKSTGMGKATELNLLFAGQNKRGFRAAGDHAVQLTATRSLILVIYGTIH